MKNKKTEANLSMIVSKTFSGLNANALKYLLPLWIAPLTGVMFRCVFAAIVFWIISIFWKQDKITRREKITLFLLGAIGLYGFMFFDLGIHPVRHFPTGTYYGDENNRYRDRLGRRTALHPDAEKRRFGFRCFYG